MKKITAQEKFWSSKFGKEYIQRNYRSNKELDTLYVENLGVPRSKINKDFLDKIRPNNILEVGCNMGNQLTLLQSQGFKNLYGIEIYDLAVELAKKRTKNINIIQGNAFDLPFKDNCFELIFTSGVLIHINPKDIKKVMKEIYRVSKKYIWGFEYYNNAYINVLYHGSKDKLWKGNFAKMYLDEFPDLKLIKERKYKYLKNENVDSGFLLEKISKK